MQYVVDTIELKKLMIENHIETISELERLTGVNRNTLSDVLNGKIFPSAHVIGKLITVLHISNENVGRVFFVAQELT